MNVVDSLLSKGHDYSPAVVAKDSSLNYRDLKLAVHRLSSGMLAQGLRKGERVGIFCENSPFFVVSYLSAIRAGLVAVPLQTELPVGGCDRIVSNAGIKEIFVSDRYALRLRSWAVERGIALRVESALEGLFAKPSATMPAVDPKSDLAALMFTSGSTGDPKGVMVSHRNIECNTRDVVSYLGLGPEDSAMVVLPFHYCFGISLLHTHLMAGGSVVLNNNFKLYPESVLLEMQERKCTGLAGVPSTFQILLRKSRFSQMAFPKLRWFQQAGGKLPNSYIQEILKSFPRIRFFLMYGQTEGTARLSYLPPERLEDKLGSIGKGLPSTRLEVARADGGKVLPGSQEVGEIVACGDNVALGYWNDPQETSKYFREGRLFTGDIARVDADGFLFVVERERDMIKSGGNRVSAQEVEDVITEIDGVTEVAVVGVPHEILGEAIKAFVVVSPGTEILPEAVLRHCRQRLPMFKTPQEILFLPAMPHSSSGKIRKFQLRSMVAEQIEARSTGSFACSDGAFSEDLGGMEPERTL